MSLHDTLRVIVAALDDAGIPHMIAGSLASTYHGEPRATQAIGMVIDPPSDGALERFAGAPDRGNASTSVTTRLRSPGASRST